MERGMGGEKIATGCKEHISRKLFTVLYCNTLSTHSPCLPAVSQYNIPMCNVTAYLMFWILQVLLKNSPPTFISSAGVTIAAEDIQPS
jgi:hypothetical protein